MICSVYSTAELWWKKAESCPCYDTEFPVKNQIDDFVARLNVWTKGVPCTDSLLKEYLFCSPKYISGFFYSQELLACSWSVAMFLECDCTYIKYDTCQFWVTAGFSQPLETQSYGTDTEVRAMYYFIMRLFWFSVMTGTLNSPLTFSFLSCLRNLCYCSENWGSADKEWIQQRNMPAGHSKRRLWWRILLL